MEPGLQPRTKQHINTAYKIEYKSRGLQLLHTDGKMNETNTDLLANRNKYSVDILEKNIVKNHLDEKILLATQTLTPEFCVKYILDLDIDGGGEESYIFDVCYILGFQKHITEEELENAMNAHEYEKGDLKRWRD